MRHYGRNPTRYSQRSTRPKAQTEAERTARMANDQRQIQTNNSGEIRCWTQPWWEGSNQVGVITRNGEAWRVETHEAGSFTREDEDYPTLEDLTEKWSVTVER